MENYTTPQNLDAERSVIAALIRDSSGLVHKVSDVLEMSCFAYTPNGTIFGEIVHLETQNKTITPITLQESLKTRGKLAEAGGASYIAELLKSQPEQPSAVLEHARIVAEKARLRHALVELEDAQNNLKGDDSADTAAVLAAGQRVLDIASKTRVFRAITPAEGCAEVIQQINTSIERQGALLGVSTGFRQLDRTMFGFEPTKLYILAARPGIGKTTFLMNIAENVAISAQFRQRAHVLFFSLEMAYDELYLRLLCGRAGVDSTRVKTGEATPLLLEKVQRAAADCEGANLEIDDIPARSIDDIRIRANRFVKGLPPGEPCLVCVDYLQLISADVRKSESREREIAKVSVGLKAMAKQLRIPVLAAAQLRRAADDKKYPQLSDLRESGAIEQDADVVMFLHKMQDDAEKEGEEEGHALYDTRDIKLIVAKNRGGPLAQLNYELEAKYTKFVEKRYTNDYNEDQVESSLSKMFER